jgi:hypothetical protein
LFRHLVDEEIMIAKAGHRWIVILTLPSGAKFICGEHEGKLALIPMEDGKPDLKVKNVLSWNDSKDVSRWLKEFLSKMTEQQRNGFMQMRPDLGLVRIQH